MRTTTLSTTFDWQAYQNLHGDNAVLLLACDPGGWIHVATQPLEILPGPDWTVVALIKDSHNAIA